MTEQKQFSWSADNSTPVRLLRKILPRGRRRHRIIMSVHRFYKWFNTRFRNLPAQMPADFSFVYRISRTHRGKRRDTLYDINAARAVVKMAESDSPRQGEKLSPEWTEKNASISRADLEIFYRAVRETGCIYFEVDRGQDISFEGYFTYNICIVANGVEYNFGESSELQFYDFWSVESERLMDAATALLDKYELLPRSQVIR